MSMMKMRRKILAACATLAGLTSATVAMAGEADVTKVAVQKIKEGVYNFAVTIRSNDAGWDAYADRFEIIGPDGQVLGVRKLLHPHEDEQPFTRDSGNTAIPADVRTVTVKAHHKRAGYDGATASVELPR